MAIIYQVYDENDELISWHGTRENAIKARRDYLTRNPEVSDRDSVKIRQRNTIEIVEEGIE